MEINQYPLESLAFQDDDFYDIDFWTGSGYQTKKILGSTIKAGILAAVENIYNADGTLTSNRSINLDNKVLSLESANAGEFNSLISDSTTSTSTFNQSIAQIYLAIVDILTAGKNIAFDINTTNTQLVLNDGAGNSSSLEISSVGSALNFTDGITNFRVEANQNGVLVNSSYILPNTDGTAGQVMTTNGAGVASWNSIPVPSFTESSRREVVEFINKTGAPLLEGTIVYLKSTSSSGTHPEVELADASTEVTSSKTIGAIYETTANNAIGLIVTSGEVDNLDTSMYSIGDRLWLSTTAGQVTTTPPASPDHLVFIGIVTRAQNGNGRILYSIQNGYELNELHDVLVPSPNNGDVLTFNSVSGLWEAEAAVESNIYNTDGTLTGSRVVSLVNNDLTFSGNGSERFIVSIDDGTNAVLIDAANAFGVALSASSSGGASLLQITTAGININGQYTLPNTDGTSGQVVTTDGAGNLSFTTISGSTAFIPQVESTEIRRGLIPLSGTTTVGTFGALSPVQTGSAVAVTFGGTIRLPKLRLLTTTGSTNSVVGIAFGTSGLVNTLGLGFRFIGTYIYSDQSAGGTNWFVPNARQFCGLAAQSTILPINSGTPVDTQLNIIGIGSDATDTNLQIFHNDNTGTATKIDLGVNFPANKTGAVANGEAYQLELYAPYGATSVKYRVTKLSDNTIVTGTITTDLPALTTALGPQVVRTSGITSQNVSIDIIQLTASTLY